MPLKDSLPIMVAPPPKVASRAAVLKVAAVEAEAVVDAADEEVKETSVNCKVEEEVVGMEAAVVETEMEAVVAAAVSSCSMLIWRL